MWIFFFFLIMKSRSTVCKVFQQVSQLFWNFGMLTIIFAEVKRLNSCNPINIDNLRVTGEMDGSLRRVRRPLMQRSAESERTGLLLSFKV